MARATLLSKLPASEHKYDLVKMSYYREAKLIGCERIINRIRRKEAVLWVVASASMPLALSRVTSAPHI